MITSAKEKKGKAVSAKALKQMAKGIARMVNGQRLFAEEFGLPYSRIFYDGFESFKDKPVEAVIREWVSADGEDSEAIERLFSDLLAHQLALVEALEEITRETQEVTGLPRIFSFLRGGSAHNKKGMHQHYMEVVAPKFVLAYSRSRHQKNALVDSN